jgi:hypothetical protein
VSRQLLYVAHPLAPSVDDLAAMRDLDVFKGENDEYDCGYDLCVERCALRANMESAMKWLAWLRASFPETTFIAPWIATVMSLDGDDSPELREAGLVDDCTVIERCDGIVLVGARISSGMRREMEHGLAQGLDDSCEPHIQTFEVYHLIGYQIEGDSGHSAGGSSFVVWIDRYRESCTR